MAKKFKRVKDFQANACEVQISADHKSCTIFVDVDGWDSHKKAYHDIEVFAEGNNDPMACDIEEELAEMGLELVYPGEVDEEGTVIDFELLKIDE
jgi:hypothetical protein